MAFTKTLVIVALLLLLGSVTVPGQASADTFGQRVDFFVDPSFDIRQRSELSATLRLLTNQFYLYIEDEWWDSLSSGRKTNVLNHLESTAYNFEQSTYPKLTEAFGTENKPGVDNDNRITVLVHRAETTVGGYVRTADAYTRFEAPQSNEREMFYIGTDRVESPLLSSFFAHEFVHLIHLNQKELAHRVFEDAWIQEGFAELAPTIAEFNNPYKDSYLENRVRDFIANPRVSLAEWRNSFADYGAVTLFFHYVHDQYGTGVLRDAMQSPRQGTAAFDDAFAKNGIQKTFSDLFTDWTIAVYLNDCSIGERFCYKTEPLTSIKITPFSNFLSSFGDSELRVSSQTKEWAGNWNRITGGRGTLVLAFEGAPEASFRVPYLLQDKDGGYELKTFELNAEQKGTIEIQNFGEEYIAVVLLPVIQGKEFGFGFFEASHLYSWTAQTFQGTPGENQQSQQVQALLQQIAQLQAQVALLQAQLASMNGGNGGISCAGFNTNLAFGLSNNQEVRCLQQVLRNQGQAIYPEGLVTGNFLSLTRQAVVRFQEQYREEILAPVGLQQGTGFVGPQTRAKLNQLLTTLS